MQRARTYVSIDHKVMPRKRRLFDLVYARHRYDGAARATWKAATHGIYACRGCPFIFFSAKHGTNNQSHGWWVHGMVLDAKFSELLLVLYICVHCKQFKSDMKKHVVDPSCSTSLLVWPLLLAFCNSFTQALVFGPKEFWCRQIALVSGSWHV